MYCVRVVIEPVVENGIVKNYGLYAPEWPGCVASGDSMQEAVALMRQALAMHLPAVGRGAIPPYNLLLVLLWSDRGTGHEGPVVWR